MKIRHDGMAWDTVFGTQTDHLLELPKTMSVPYPTPDVRVTDRRNIGERPMQCGFGRRPLRIWRSKLFNGLSEQVQYYRRSQGFICDDSFMIWRGNEAMSKCSRRPVYDLGQIRKILRVYTVWTLGLTLSCVVFHDDYDDLQRNVEKTLRLAEWHSLLEIAKIH